MFEACVAFACNLSAYSAIGIIGFLGYLTGYSLLQFRLIDGNSTLYSVISVSSATLVLISLSENFNLASALIQTSWIVIGSCGIFLRIFRADPAGRALKS